MHQRHIKVEASVWGQGCVSVALEVEPLLVPPLLEVIPFMEMYSSARLWRS
jgi:hypothetical protein